MDKDGLIVDSDGAVGWDGDPVITLECQRLASDKDDVGSSVTSFHSVVGLVGRRSTLLLPAGTGAEEQAGSLVGSAANITGAYDALAIGHSKVEQTARVAFSDTFWKFANVAVDALDSLEDGLAQDTVAKSVCLGFLVVWVIAQSFQTVEEQCKAPLRVGAACDASEPSVANIADQLPLDTTVPTSNSSIVHKHQASATERMAIAFGQSSLGTGADVSENEWRDGLAG